MRISGISQAKLVLYSMYETDARTLERLKGCSLPLFAEKPGPTVQFATRIKYNTTVCTDHGTDYRATYTDNQWAMHLIKINCIDTVCVPPSDDVSIMYGMVIDPCTNLHVAWSDRCNRQPDT